HPSIQVNVEVHKEAALYGDMVVLPFIDRYDLVVLKTIAICEFGLRNVSTNYIMKVDDDNFVRLDAVFDEIRFANHASGLYMGNINEFHKPLREGKWAVSEEEWPETNYPPYANGPGYIVTRDIADFIVRMKEYKMLRIFKMEDVSMGMWVVQYGINNTIHYIHNWRFCQFGCMDDYLTAHYQSPRQMLCMWTKLSRGEASSIRGSTTYNLYLQNDSRDSVSLFDHTYGASLAPPATADSATRSQWLTRDAAACLAVRNHLPLAKRAHFGQHKTAKALYDAVVARYSSPAIATLGRLILPYLFPELSAFATVEDLVTHLRTSDARYCAALPTEFLDRNPPPMDHFLALDPTDLTINLLEKHLLAAEASVVAVGAARGTPRTPFFKECSPSPLAPSYASAAAVDILGAEDVGAASDISGKRCSSKGKGGKSGGTGSGGGGVGGGGGGSGGGSGSVGRGSGGGRGGAVQRGGSDGGQMQQLQRRSETPTPQQLREWFAQRGASGGSVRCPYVICTVDIFALDYDAILAAMYALSVSAEGDCYLCVPPDPGMEAAALSASESALPCTVLAEALHTFTLDSGASRCFFRGSTTLTPLPAPLSVRLADSSWGPVLARSSTVLPCSAVPSGSLLGLHLPSFSTNLVSTAALQDAMVTTTTPGGWRVLICMCTRMGHHLATLTRQPGSSLYTLTTEPPRVAASAQVSASGPVAAPCSCRLLSHQTLAWHHQLGHPSLPCLHGMHSHLLASGLPRSLPPLPPLPAPPCLPCVEGQGAAPHSSWFPATTAPLQTLHMDVWGPARFSGQGRERYFLLSVSSSANGSARTFLRDFCRGEGILQSFTLPAFPQQNRVAERRIGLVMEVAHTSMVHAVAPHFLWPFAVRYATHQLNPWPHVSLPETSPTLRWMGKVGVVTVFWVWGSRAFVLDTSADKLSSRAIPCVFHGFPPDAPGWQFYHPTSRCVLLSQDVTFDESIPFYRVSQVDPLPGTVPVEVTVDSSSARGAASGGVASGGAASRGAELASVELGGAEPEGAEFGGAEPGGVEPGGTEPEDAEPEGAESEGAESEGVEPRAHTPSEWRCRSWRLSRWRH
ncbi:unnamed protein product, partial [Closterium sp. NIES-53]